MINMSASQELNELIISFGYLRKEVAFTQAIKHVHFVQNTYYLQNVNAPVWTWQYE